MIWAGLSKDLRRGGIVALMIMTIDKKGRGFSTIGDSADDNQRCFKKLLRFAIDYRYPCKS